MSETSVVPSMIPARVAFDLEFITWLAHRLRAATGVLDDIQGCQILEGRRDETRREIVREAVTRYARETSTRLLQEIAKAAPRKGVA